MYPIFITDDPEAEVEIPTLPGQKRWGINRLEGFLRPLVEKGLKSVILFGVPLELEKVSSESRLVRKKRVLPKDLRMNSAHTQTPTSPLSSKPSSSSQNSSLDFSSQQMSASVNTRTTVIAASPRLSSRTANESPRPTAMASTLMQTRLSNRAHYLNKTLPVPRNLHTPPRRTASTPRYQTTSTARLIST
jgi:hypothetical protein